MPRARKPRPSDERMPGQGAPGLGSPYSTGGGGVTFERRVAALFLARLLSGETHEGLQGYRVNRISFQSVEDFVVEAGPELGESPTLALVVAARRAPRFIASDGKTEEIITKFLRLQGESDRTTSGVPRFFAFCVAGRRSPAEEVAELAALAKSHSQADTFFKLLREPKKFRKKLVKRLDHVVKLVAQSCKRLGDEYMRKGADKATWGLLSCLEVLMPRLEPPDESDWTNLLNALEPWSREQNLVGAEALRDRLVALAQGYAPAAAVVELALLRRDASFVLYLERRRQQQAWAALKDLEQEARQSVRSEIGAEATRIHLARSAEAAKVRALLGQANCVLVAGESGVGKSALVLRELAAVAAARPEDMEFVFLSLRLLPRTTWELRSVVKVRFEGLLTEMSAPGRVLVLDSAEFMGESSPDVLRYLVGAANRSDVQVWVISSTEGRGGVRAILEELITPIVDHEIGPLTDEDLERVEEGFPHLRELLANSYSKDLLRRPVVADLLARAGSSSTPMSEADALEIFSRRLIRADGRTSRGTPDGREQVVRHLARHQLHPEGGSELFRNLDPIALDGLRRDGLIRPNSPSPWQLAPEFSHDLIRTFAVSKVLLADGEVVAGLLEVGAPRWALPAARLAAQVLLAAPDTDRLPVEGRLSWVQEEFDRLPEAGHGARWAELPTEALLPLPNAGEVLRDSWAWLTEEDPRHLERVLRVLAHRRRRVGVADTHAPEPVISLLLELGWPREERFDKEVDELVRAWLLALVLRREPRGNAVRESVRTHILNAVRAGDEELARLAEERAAELAARTPEQVHEEEERAEELRHLTMSIAGLGPTQSRRNELPDVLVDDSTLAQVALLGPDLGEEGAALLRRVGEHAPAYLAPALEELGAGHALASYSLALLVDLVESYYLETDDTGGPELNYGIRGHQPRGIGPLAAPHLGPFLAMFQADLPSGVACLNRLLNHAAEVRSEVLWDRPWSQRRETSDGEHPFRTTFSITGEPRTYLGDEHVWLWYRGTGVGPYPCMSALKALEVVCDQAIRSGIAPGALVPLLLDGCQNLAMPGLVVGLLVRHLETAGNALDVFFSEPRIWKLEFLRVMNEHGPLAGSAEGTDHVERRKWSLREAAMACVLSAEGERIDELHKVGEMLVFRAEAALQEIGERQSGGGDTSGLEAELAAVRGWAAALDLHSYQARKEGAGVRVEYVVPQEVEEELAESNRDLELGRESIELLGRYAWRAGKPPGLPLEIDQAQLEHDLAAARNLLDEPPDSSPGGPLAAPAAVAAGALECSFLETSPVSEDDLVWAGRVLVEISSLCEHAAKSAEQSPFSVYLTGPDRSAGRGIPFLLLPKAADLRSALTVAGIPPPVLSGAARWLMTQAPYEVRLLFARGLDHVWRAACDGAEPECQHVLALELVEDSARSCVIGERDWEAGRSRRERLEGPLEEALLGVPDKKIIVPELSAAIRALGAAANSSSCCASRAEVLLSSLLAAHRRGMAAREQPYHGSQNDTLIAARALLLEATHGEEEHLLRFIGQYSVDARLLAELLKALSAAGEEDEVLAAVACRIWPEVMDQVLDLRRPQRRTYRAGYFGSDDLAALIPRPAYESAYLHRELRATPMAWSDLPGWREQVERWLVSAAGRPSCVDSLIEGLGVLTPDQQVVVGLPWIESLVAGRPQEVAKRSWQLPEWLKEIRPHVSRAAGLAAWQRVVDLLMVAGDSRVAELSD